ncbi:MAG: hypothetical protein QGH69_00760 [Alphaproteobacteria bacterium]|jgi:hypothetical protein|nr:hypothetical protein [Alphaproteobacteria bacterium]
MRFSRFYNPDNEIQIARAHLPRFLVVALVVLALGGCAWSFLEQGGVLLFLCVRYDSMTRVVLRSAGLASQASSLGASNLGP